MRTITRKTMLYKTGVEYGDYTMNHVLGCSHGCKYPCYAYMQKKRFGQVKTYDDWCKPCLVSNTIDILKKEIPRLRNKIKSVQLCFTTDPFMYGYDEVANMSLAAIQLLNKYDIKCNVLTKGILPAELAEPSKFLKSNEYGITLVSCDDQYRKKYEPGSAPFNKRLKALRYLSDKGYKTWVSMEPYPTPNLFDQNLQGLLKTVAFTNKIIFGRTNYSTEVSKGYPNHKDFYNEAATEVIDFCTSNRIDYHIKNKTITG